jgi:hypothetical protein
LMPAQYPITATDKVSIHRKGVGPWYCHICLHRVSF